MNKAITEGLDLMPPDFVDGLSVWSSGDGTIGSTTYATDPSGTLAASDPDFGDCLEIFTGSNPQRLRYMGETPILPGCYLEVSARVKLVAGPFTQVRIAGLAGDANGATVTGVPTTGPLVALNDYSRVYTVRAIIGSGQRTGVDMVWGTTPVYGHLGLDIVGDPGSVVRIEKIVVEDRTAVFHRKMMDWVDVRDFGAIGDGVANDAAAFENADAAAAGRMVMVPAGTYLIDKNVTMLSPVRFEGTIVQPDGMRFVLRHNFDYPSYVEAFGDETLALKKALQALFNYADHDTLDLCGRQVNLTEPIDVAAAVGNVTDFTQRRVLRNGGLVAENTGAWEPEVVTATASYSTADALKLTNVTNVASIAVGSLVEGFGVGREVYVRSRDEANGELTLSLPLARAAASQSYTFTRFKYMLDFSGFNRVNGFIIDGVEFRGNGRGNGILLSDRGIWWIIRNCWFFKAGLRGITSHGEACQGITIEQCEFNATDSAALVQDRKSIGFNTNKNDAKIRGCRGINLRHFGVMSGNGNLIVGNHFWQLDSPDPGERTAGLVFCDKRSKTTITGNYIDNQFLEFTNEHQAGAGSSGNEAFGRVSITGNIFTATKVASWFRFIVWSPIGSNHKLDGISVLGNTFQLFGGARIDRVEAIDTSQGSINHELTRDLVWDANGYGDVDQRTQSPALVRIEEASNKTTWSAELAGQLPFGGQVLGVDGVTAHGPIRNSSNQVVTAAPHVETQKGSQKNRVDVVFPQAVRGAVELRVRVDRAN